MDRKGSASSGAMARSVSRVKFEVMFVIMYSGREMPVTRWASTLLLFSSNQPRFVRM